MNDNIYLSGGQNIRRVKSFDQPPESLVVDHSERLAILHHHVHPGLVHFILPGSWAKETSEQAVPYGIALL